MSAGDKEGAGAPPPPVVDPITEAVRADLHARSQVGLRKYGTPLSRTDLTGAQWVQHLYEELLDAAQYAKRLMVDAPVLGPILRMTHRHRKRGTLYAEVGRGTLLCSRPVEISTDLVAYQDEYGHLWFRPAAEFDDGRFEKLEG